MAVVSSLRSFDREQQKEYEVPIVIKDSGNPSMSGNIFSEKKISKDLNLQQFNQTKIFQALQL